MGTMEIDDFTEEQKQLELKKLAELDALWDGED